MAESCVICCNNFDKKTNNLYAVGSCEHSDICSVCFLRLRSLQRTFTCPTCKQDLDTVVCTESRVAFKSFSFYGKTISKQDYTYDEKSQMFFPSPYFRNCVEQLWMCKCKKCDTTRRDMKSLKGHCLAEHNLHICGLCVEFKQVFPSEQRSYTQQQFDTHLKKGDGDGSTGHPNCEFCRKRYYDSNALFVHLSKDHYTCFLCENQGIMYKYFKDYVKLEDHFRTGHYLCTDRTCLDKKFVVFANDIEMQKHNITYHPHLRAKRIIDVSFKTVERGRRQDSSHEPDSKSGNGSSSSSSNADVTMTNGRYEGGLGGRATDEGEWLVQIDPTHWSADPRNPNRNAHINIAGASAPREATESEKQGEFEDVAEDFPSLMVSNPTAAVTAAPAGGLLNNKWISLDESGGTQSQAKNKIKNKKSGISRGADDFPSLQPSVHKPCNNTSQMKFYGAEPAEPSSMAVSRDSLLGRKPASTHASTASAAARIVQDVGAGSGVRGGAVGYGGYGSYDGELTERAPSTTFGTDIVIKQAKVRKPKTGGQGQQSSKTYVDGSAVLTEDEVLQQVLKMSAGLKPKKQSTETYEYNEVDFGGAVLTEDELLMQQVLKMSADEAAAEAAAYESSMPQPPALNIYAPTLCAPPTPPLASPAGAPSAPYAKTFANTYAEPPTLDNAYYPALGTSSAKQPAASYIADASLYPSLGDDNMNKNRSTAKGLQPTNKKAVTNPGSVVAALQGMNMLAKPKPVTKKTLSVLNVGNVTKGTSIVGGGTGGIGKQANVNDSFANYLPGKSNNNEMYGQEKSFDKDKLAGGGWGKRLGGTGG